MRHLRSLLALLALSLALPSGARADTGWSQEVLGVHGPSRAAAARRATVAPAAPAGPFTLFTAPGADFPVLIKTDGHGPRASRCRAAPGHKPTDHSSSLLAAHSRLKAAQRSFLQISPSLAVATRGVVGFHTSPAPPLS
jgi:hypothetical protein